VVRIVKPKQIVFYADKNGDEPFQSWLEALRDKQGRRRIIMRLSRLQQGNYGDVELIGDGLSELRMSFGPGYRLYFDEDAENLVVVLCAGDKSSQGKDIENAKAYWQEYKTNAKSENA
jgi:putative addiction module killer protein